MEEEESMVGRKRPRVEAKSDLLSRVSAFLPQIQEANAQLASEQSSNGIDVNLLREGESGSDESDQGDIEENGKEPPTIKLDIALGNMGNNPAFALLADDSSSSSEDNKKDEEDGNDKGDEEISKVLIMDDGDRKRKQETDDSTSTKPKPLITELP